LYEILTKKELASKVKLFEVNAPEMAEKVKPGQFLIVIADERGERVPLTIADYDQKKGSVSFVFNEVGKSTKQLGLMNVGDAIWNITGPLGVPSEVKCFGRVLCVAGGVLAAPMLLQVKTLKTLGNHVTAVVGARIKDLLIYEEEMKTSADEVFVATDDGSKGYTGLSFLEELLGQEKFDRCVVMGPVVMLKQVCEITKPFGIPTVVTLTPIMIDGMGMCGVCRVTVGGRMRFACVDGPEFDGHQVDFDELVKRQRMFLPEERLSSLWWELQGGCACERRQA
jgi:ferredoxin--NADP+ reductase